MGTFYSSHVFLRVVVDGICPLLLPGARHAGPHPSAPGGREGSRGVRRVPQRADARRAGEQRPRGSARPRGSGWHHTARVGGLWEQGVSGGDQIYVWSVSNLLTRHLAQQTQVGRGDLSLQGGRSIYPAAHAVQVQYTLVV
jgi:hypothetical protein